MTLTLEDESDIEDLKRLFPRCAASLTHASERPASVVSRAMKSPATDAGCLPLSQTETKE